MSLIGTLADKISHSTWGINSAGYTLEQISCIITREGITKQDLEDIEKELKLAEESISKCRHYLSKANKVVRI